MTTTFRSRSLAAAVAVGSVLLAGCQGEVETAAPDDATAPETAFELPQAARDAATEAITADALRTWVAALSSDEMEGRGPGSEGDRKARAYLVEQLREIGLEPAGPDGSWEQTFAMVGLNATMPASWTFRKAGGSGEVTLRRHDDFIAASGVQEPKASLDGAELVFVGYGIQAPEFDWDDYKGVDLSGKVLVMLNNDPDWDPELFAGERRLYYGRWDYKYESAARQGAAGAIIVHTVPSAGYPFQVVQTSWTGEQFELPAGDEPRVKVEAWVTEEAAGELAKLAGRQLDELVEAAHSRDFAPIPLGITTSLELPVTVRSIETANVLARVPGGDPALQDTVVAYTAHHDHLGVGEPNAEGDRIYNGALDNASGSAQLLAIARAFSSLPAPPDRSVLFAWVAAEEQGLLGSKYFAEHPTVPPGKIAAVLNFDGGNIWGRTKDVTFVGLEKSELGTMVEKYAAEQGRTVKPDQFPDRGFYYRSDQFSFAKIGVPGVYLDAGTEFVDRPEGWGKEQIEAWEAEHYHQPSDELTDTWSFDGMIDDAQLGFFVGLEIAETATMPAWTPGDEFEAARQQALAAVE